MKKKKLKVTIIFTILMMLIITDVRAWYIPNKTSFAVGSIYDDNINTTIDANNAHIAYSSMGLSYAKKLNNPTMVGTTNSHANGTAYLNSGIVFFSGHGSADHLGMKFQNNGSGTFYIKSGVSNSNTININSYNNALTALIVWGGCQTADGTNNAAKLVIDQGVKSSIGWVKNVSQGSHTNWLKRFNNKIKDKSTTVSAAKTSADNHIYLDNRVKAGKIYGFGNYNPWYFMNGGSYSSTSSETNHLRDIENLEFNQALITNELIDENADNVFRNYIKDNYDKNFDSENFVLEITMYDNIYYDYILYVDDVRTNYGYVASIEDGKIAKISNNMGEYSVKELNNLIENKYEQKSNYKLIDDKFDERVNMEFPNIEKERYILTNYYDEQENRVYRVAIYDIIDIKSDSIFTVEYREEI